MLFTTLSTAWKLKMQSALHLPVGVSWKEEKHRHWKTACREDLRSCFPPSCASCPAHSRQPKPGSGLGRRHGLFVSAFQAARRGQQESRLRRKVLAHQEETWRRRQRTYSPSSVLSSRTPSETRRGGTRLTRLLSGLRCQTTSSFEPCVQQIFTMSDHMWLTKLCVKGSVLWQTQGMVVPGVSAFAQILPAPPAESITLLYFSKSYH